MEEPRNNRRAVVVAMSGGVQLETGLCTPMIPLVDRPFLQHVVECLVDRGFKTIDFLLHDGANGIETHFGNGQRWGAEFRFHLVREKERPYARLKKLGLDQEFLLVEGDQLQPEQWTNTEERSGPAVFVWDQDGSNRLSNYAGAAWIAPPQLEQLNLDVPRHELERQLIQAAGARGEVIPVARPLSASTFADIIDAQRRVLGHEFPELTRLFASGEQGISIGRNVYLDTLSGSVSPPIYIGPNSTVEGGTKLGPNVVIMDGAYIHGKCEISDALILPNSLVGEGLSIRNCVLDQHRFFHTELDVAVSVDDNLLMGGTQLRLPGKTFLRRLCSRSMAILTLAIFSPVLLVLMAIHKLKFGAALEFNEYAKFPVSDTEKPETYRSICLTRKVGIPNSNWNHFWLDLLPGLVNVVRGDVGWVGVAPLTTKQVRELPNDLSPDYLQCEAGLINESIIMYGRHGNRDERLMAEIYYAVTTRSLFARVMRIKSYFFSVLSGPRANCQVNFSLRLFKRARV